jgi:threonine 3-dehydrogenase
MSETILITGGGGNLACQLSFLLVERGAKVVLTDVAPQPTAPCDPLCEYIAGDLRTSGLIEDLVARHKPTTIIHFASLLSGSSEVDRAVAWEVNMTGAFRVFESAVAHGVRKVLFPSSVASFGTPLPEVVADDCPQWPVGFYGVTKVAVERIGHYYHHRHGVDFRCLRVPITISAYANPNAASSYASQVFVQSLRDGRFSFLVRPTAKPALIYVRDLLRAFLLLMDAPRENLTRCVYNVHGLSPTAAEIADAVRQRLPDARIDFTPEASVADLIDSWPQQFDDSPARRDWGWRPAYGLDGLADDFLATLSKG